MVAMGEKLKAADTVTAILAMNNPAIGLGCFRLPGWARALIIGILFAESAISVLTLLLCRRGAGCASCSHRAVSRRRNRRCAG